MRWLVLVTLLQFSTAHATDLETLLENTTDAKVESVANQPQNFLVDSIKSLLPKITPEQNVFFISLGAGEWVKALLNYQAAFGAQPFETSATGRALLAYLEFKSDLQVTGLEQLFTVTEPQKIHFHLLSLIREAMPASHSAWVAASVQWTPAWTEIFGGGIESKTVMRDISFNRNIDELSQMALRAPASSPERAMIEWNLAVAYSLHDQAAEAAKVIAGLLKAKNNPISVDLMNITAARLLFQNGYFDAAAKYYKKVAKSSEYWIEAQEELSWSYIRKGEPQNGLAVAQTLVNPAFASQVSPESFFLKSLAQLKVCDYPAVVEGLQAFPKRFRDRTLALSKLAENADQPKVVEVLQLMQKGPLTSQSLGPKAKDLPRFMSRDEKLYRLIGYETILQKEAKAAEAVYVKSLAQTGLQSFFDSLKQKIVERARVAHVSVITRVQTLADQEVKETKKILDKMHIIEAEVIQQVGVAERMTALKVASADLKTGTATQSPDALRFPMEKEVWFDELANYKVDIKKGCQAKR